MKNGLITLNKKQIDEMIEHSRAEAPAEACGLLIGKKGQVQKIQRMTNIDESNKRYMMDPKEQFKVFKELREEGLKLVGIYHSHVASQPYPSETDCKMAVYDVAYFIVSLQTEEPIIKAFKIKDGKVAEREFKIM